MAPSQKADARLKADCEGKLAAHQKADAANAGEAKTHKQVPQQTAAARHKADCEKKYKPGEQQATQQMAATRHKVEREGKVAAHLKAENEHETAETADIDTSMVVDVEEVSDDDIASRVRAVLVMSNPTLTAILILRRMVTYNSAQNTGSADATVQKIKLVTNQRCRKIALCTNCPANKQNLQYISKANTLTLLNHWN